ncbi:NYN domain-containing protein [Patescibacteria group bacterium]|nr:NYN domain-containing protein [Patescibacteria group bacterium]
MTNGKVAIFIDAGNLWSSYIEMGKVLDFQKLNSFVESRFDAEMFKTFYYVAHPKEGTREKDDIDRLHKFCTFLKKGLDYIVVKKELKTIFLRDQEGELVYDESGEPKSHEKGNFDVEITMDALRYSSAYDVAVFFTGDSDFLPLISYLSNLKQPKKVYIFSTKGCVSRELRTGADGYFDLHNCPEIHGNDLVHRKK